MGGYKGTDDRELTKVGDLMRQSVEFAQSAQITALKVRRMGVLRARMVLARWRTATLLRAGRPLGCWCPCCENPCAEWVDWSSTYRKVICPNCESQPRHRALILHLKRHTRFYQDSLAVLHVAPEHFLRRLFLKLPKLQYLTADLKRGAVDIRLDVAFMPFGANTFHVVLASHVLEHVEDDRAALREILRVLSPGGFAFLQVPVSSAAETLEDPGIRSPRERLYAYRQEDHFRLYGRDYVDRVAQIGFVVRSENPGEALSEEDIYRYGLLPLRDLVFGYKPV